MGVEIVGGIPHFERTMQDGARSVTYLCELAAERGLRVDLRLTQTDLGQLVGSTRETTSMAFNAFKRDGLVDAKDRTVWVLQSEALAAY